MKSGATKAHGHPAGSIPDELGGSVPRDVELTKHGIAIVAVAGALAVAALAAAALLSALHRRGIAEQELRSRDSVVATATVTRVVPRSNDRRRVAVSYTYSVDGREFRGDVDRRMAPATRPRPGDHLAVAFLRSRPDQSWMPDRPPRDGPPLLLVPFVSLLLAGLAFGIAFSVRRQWQLLAEGRVVAGIVTPSRRLGVGRKGASCLEYEFRPLGGSRAAARFDASKRSLSAGEAVVVVYHRDNPRWSSLYPFEFVRPRRPVRTPRA